jgi:acyl-coenzyme A thioesterase 9
MLQSFVSRVTSAARSAEAIAFSRFPPQISALQRSQLRFVSGLSLMEQVARPSSLHSLTADINVWGLDLPFTRDLVEMHGEFSGMVPFCCPAHPLSPSGKRGKESSWLEILLPFSDPKCIMRRSMVNYGGKAVRYGKLFEVIDSLAGDVGYRHCRGCDDITIVTASVDGMSISAVEDITTDKDLVVQAFLTYVGKSSMEIHVNLVSANKLIACTQFIMVARHGVNGGAYEIPGLEVTSQADKDEFARGQVRAARRKLEAKNSLAIVPPRQDEVAMIHQLHLRSKGLKAQKRALLMNRESTEKTRHFKYMKSTLVQSTEFMHPQNRNVHGKVFGGEIMRKSFEMAYITAASFIGRDNTRFVAVDDINFILPVNVGSIMIFTGQITYCASTEVVVLVTVDECEAETMERTRTNQLSYVFKTRDEKVAPEVIPEDYGEFVRFLDGRRTYEDAIVNREK